MDALRPNLVSSRIPTFAGWEAKSKEPERENAFTSNKHVPTARQYDSSDDDSPYIRAARPNNNQRRRGKTYARTATGQFLNKLSIKSSLTVHSDSDSSSFSPAPAPKSSRLGRLPDTPTTFSLETSSLPKPSSPFEALQQRLTKANARIVELEDELVTSMEHADENLTRLQDATSLVQSLQSKLHSTEQEAAHLRKQATAAATHNTNGTNADHLKGKTELLERQLVALRASNEQAQAERDGLAKAYAVLQTQLQQMQSELAAASSSINPATQELQAKLLSLNQEQQVQLAQLDQERDIYLQQAETMKATIANLQTELVQAQQTHQAAQDELHQMSMSAEHEVGRLAEDLELVHQAYKELEAANAQTAAELDAAKQHAVAEADKRQEAEMQLKYQEQQLVEALQQVDSSKQSQQETEAALSVARAQAQEAQIALDNTLADLNQEQTSINATAAELNSARQQLLTMQTDLSQAKAAAANAEHQVQQLAAQRASLAEEMKAAQDALQHLKQAELSASNDKHSLQEQVDTLQQQIAMLQQAQASDSQGITTEMFNLQQQLTEAISNRNVATTQLAAIEQTMRTMQEQHQATLAATEQAHLANEQALEQALDRLAQETTKADGLVVKVQELEDLWRQSEAELQAEKTTNASLAADIQAIQQGAKHTYGDLQQQLMQSKDAEQQLHAQTARAEALAARVVQLEQSVAIRQLASTPEPGLSSYTEHQNQQAIVLKTERGGYGGLIGRKPGSVRELDLEAGGEEELEPILGTGSKTPRDGLKRSIKGSLSSVRGVVVKMPVRAAVIGFYLLMLHVLLVMLVRGGRVL